MATSSAKAKAKAPQEVCIDLPGESVQCWRSSDQVKVTLRKHRDVIFDLNLGAGKTYTVQSTHSDFYNARDKKLIFAKRREVASFNDGERLHLWVTRNFKGALELRSGNELLMKVTPNEIDQHQYDDAPKTKPAPIIITFGPTLMPKGAPSATPTTKFLRDPANLPIPATAPIDDQCSVICVVECKLRGMPDSVMEHLRRGGGKSGLAELDPTETATRNWLWGQAAGSLAYIGDNWSWLRASLDSKTHQGFRLVSAKVHLVRNKVRFYFSGYSKYNTVFGPGGFGPGHDRIMNIFAGAGKTASSFTAVGKSVAASFKNCALVSFIFGTVTAVAEWKADVKKDGYDLAASLLIGVVKAVISALLVAGVVALFVLGLMVAGLAAVPVIAIGAITLTLGVATKYGVEALDKYLGKAATGDVTSNDGLASALAPVLRKAGRAIEGAWQSLIELYPTDYERITF
jgi:hypothetical protein